MSSPYKQRSSPSTRLSPSVGERLLGLNPARMVMQSPNSELRSNPSSMLERFSQPHIEIDPAGGGPTHNWSDRANQVRQSWGAKAQTPNKAQPSASDSDGDEPILSI